MEDELKIFLSESYETLNSLDKELILLSKNPGGATQSLHTIHANYRTFLESSKFLRFQKLESLTHIGERLVNQVIESELDISSEMITTILKLNTTIREIIFTIDETGKEPTHINSSIISDVEDVIKKSEQESLTEVDDGGSSELLLAGAPATGSAENDIMDRLTNILVELIHTRVTLEKFQSELRNLKFYQAVSRMTALINDMYNQVRQAKNQPIGSLMQNLDKIVKDIAKSSGKSIALRVIGKDREVDSRQIEGIRICLIQLLKNSIEHGIEDPDERISRDKNPDGEITIECTVRGELFHIIVSDDGDGLDPAKIRKRLVDRNLLLTDEAEQIPDYDIVHYIFKDNFSGLGEHGNFIGGRASGFDIVKVKLESMGGRVYLQDSIRGKGMEVHMTFPVINSIVPIISVAFGRERYAIAKAHLNEILQIDSETLIENITVIHGYSVFHWKGKKYPLLFMKQILKAEDNPHEENPIVNLIILESRGMKVALVGDKVQDMEEAVVRPLSTQINGIYLFSGMTILQDEKPALILDVGEIVRKNLNHRELQMAISDEPFASSGEVEFGDDEEHSYENTLEVHDVSPFQALIPAESEDTSVEIEVEGSEDTSFGTDEGNSAFGFDLEGEEK